MEAIKNVVVIGSNSFSGASFVKHCLDKKYNVIGVSRSQEPDSVFLPYKWSSEGKFEFFSLDLNSDTEKIAEVIAAQGACTVVNFAAQGMVAQSWEKPIDWYRTNVLANVALHDRLRKNNNVKKYVHVSTPEVYGSTVGVITENAVFNPSTPYAASRAACDLHLRTFFSHYAFPVVFTRAANVYGPGQQLYRIIPRTMLFIRLGRKLSLHGGGVSKRSFIHIGDVADATLKIAENGRIGESYHISTEQYISIKELIEEICALMEVDFADVVEVAPERPGKDDAYYLDSSKLRSELDWDWKVNLKDGLVETLAWIDENMEVLKRQSFDYIHKA